MIVTSFYSILVNGAPYRTFQGSRGLQKGDPISPFLFIIAVKALDQLIKAAMEYRSLQGIKLSQEAPLITHQQFVDDNTLYGKPTLKQAKQFGSILEEFQQASGTLINGDKSNNFFFNTHPRVQKHLARTLGKSFCKKRTNYRAELQDLLQGLTRVVLTSSDYVFLCHNFCFGGLH